MTGQKIVPNHNSTGKRRVGSAIIKQLITWRIAAITVPCGQMPQCEARDSTVPCGWHWGPGASANKSPMSKIISANKQIEAARDREAFLGQTAKQINHLFSYASVSVLLWSVASRLSVAVVCWTLFNDSCSGEGFCCCEMSLSTANSVHSTVHTCSLHILCSFCYGHLSA